MENLGAIRFFFTIDQKFIPAIKAFLADDETFPYTREFLDWANLYVPTDAWTVSIQALLPSCASGAQRMIRDQESVKSRTSGPTRRSFMPALSRFWGDCSLIVQIFTSEPFEQLVNN